MTPPRSRIRVLIDEASIARRNEELAASILDAAGPDLLVVAILKGSFMFAADLLRALHRAGADPQAEFIQLSSYGSGQVSSGTVTIARDVESNVAGRTVLLIDDILESGRTLARARELMLARGAARVFIVVLLDKAGHRAVELRADFVGFPCPDHFVVGYGMDDGHRLRQLPFVGIVAEPELPPAISGQAS